MNDIILLVGCGKMGSALLRGWLERGVDNARIYVVDPANESRQLADELNIFYAASAQELPPAIEPRIIIFAVKPQIMDDVVSKYARFSGTSTVFLSIAAGRSITYFSERLGDRAAIVRTMPNTPAAVGRGITVSCANQQVSLESRGLCEDLLNAVGKVDWVDDEGLLDAVTATSGSGPAYVFLLIECLAEAGIVAGLPETLARQLALETVSGAGELARQSDEAPSVLRQNVTSPGGTTAAALKVLMAEDGMEQLITRAVIAAKRRSEELAG
jgi:pyrroline-5-carboxylate reductase